MGSAGLFVDRVLAVVAAVLVHLEALTVVDLGLHRDVVAPFALGAFEGDLHPLFALGHRRSPCLFRPREWLTWPDDVDRPEPFTGSGLPQKCKKSQ